MTWTPTHGAWAIERSWEMQSISVITLGVDDLQRSRHFYVDGFGWTTVFENDEIVFYQMNGFVFGTFLASALSEDMRRPGGNSSGSFALAHNVHHRGHVEPLLDKLVGAGGQLLRPADEPPQGGLRGYVADPDGHAWEVAWNPGFQMDDAGYTSFGI